jgi:3-deoxy-manno-octulosonate cytidylyltransferase (CMP-KDO synthetase)
MRSVVIIPARHASTRYPGKPLVPILGKPMILWVAELCAAAVGSHDVYIATEDLRIERVAKAAGFNVVMTSATALTGTDRVCEAAKKIDAEVYINVQGDEPLVNPADIINVKNAKMANPDYVINCFAWMLEGEDPSNINIPKLVTNERNELLYMSRLPVPGLKDNKSKRPAYKKQVCIYAFSANELQVFHSFGRKSSLEAMEDIEILRFFELNRRILMIEAGSGSIAVDVPSDIEKVESALQYKSEN